MKPNLDNVITTLKNEGVLEKEIPVFIENLTKYLAEQLYLLLAQELSEEDLRQTQAIPQEAERESKLQELFYQKTDKELKTISDEFVDSFVNNFLAAHKEVQNIQQNPTI